MDNYKKLDKLAGFYEEFDPSTHESDFDYWYIRFGFREISQFLKGDKICEFGCSTGAMTLRLIEISRKLTVVEGSAKNLNIVKNKIEREFSKEILNRRVNLVHLLWEDFSPDSEFTDVILAHGLEHVDDSVGLLTKIYKWMPSDGRLHVVVPNAGSLHRRIGVSMGLLKNRFELNDRDVKLGHKRVYDRKKLIKQLETSGFNILHWGGIYLKPLSNEQMSGWSKKLIKAFYDVGKELPDYCATIYVCATKKGD